MVRRAFTLVELLVVISIIGVLIGLLLPAVNMAREAGRKAQCSSNLKQLGYACLQHETAQGYYPSGGWGYQWVGDPTLGFGNKQPGSWIYSILPNLEQEPLYRLGGSDMNQGPPTTYSIGATQMSGGSQCMATPVAGMNCPTRRRAVTYPCTGYSPINATPATNVARSDYAANAGDVADSVIQWLGPTNMAVTLASTCTTNWLNYYSTQCQVYNTYNTSSQAFVPPPAYVEPNGVIYTGSQVRKDDISDGISNTYLLGEKYLVLENYTNYTNTNDQSDVHCMYSGCAIDNERSTYYGPPMQDRSNLPTPQQGHLPPFGSAHVNSCCFVFCDGSTHWVSYSINLGIHQLLGARNDGQPVDLSSF